MSFCIPLYSPEVCGWHKSRDSLTHNLLAKVSEAREEEVYAEGGEGAYTRLAGEIEKPLSDL